jgi:hypothetical protein
MRFIDRGICVCTRPKWLTHLLFDDDSPVETYMTGKYSRGILNLTLGFPQSNNRALSKISPIPPFL